MAAPAIRSIQTGTETIASGDGATIDITLTSVTVADCVVMLMSEGKEFSGHSIRPVRHEFYPEVTSTTNLRLTRGSSAFAKTVIVHWTVLEFDSGVTIQTGVRTGSGSSGYDDVSITAVGADCALPILYYNSDLTGTYEGFQCHPSFVETTVPRDTLRLTHTADSASPPGTSDMTIGWQILEFDSSSDVEVLFHDVDISTDRDGTKTITAVDLDATAVVSYGTEDGAPPSGARSPLMWTFDDSTTLHAQGFHIGTVPNPLSARCAVVEFKGGQKVESFTSSITGTGTAPTTQPSWTALDTDETSVFVGSNLPNSRTAEPDDTSDSNISEQCCMIVWDLDSGADGATVGRQNGGGNEDWDVTITGYAVDWTTGGGGGGRFVPGRLQNMKSRHQLIR